MRTQYQTKQLAAASGNNIALSQTPGGAGALVLNGQANNVFLSQSPAAGAGVFLLNGILSSGGQLVLDAARPLLFVSAGNFAAATITVIGTSAEGIPQTEAITGPNASTVTTTKSFKTVSAIQFSASPGAIAVTSYVATPQLDTQRVVGITGAGNDSARTFVVTGVDDNGNVISESLAGPNVNTVSTTLNYRRITSITIDAAAAGALTVGTTGVGSSTPIVLDQYLSPFSVGLEADATGTINYDVQYTYGNVFDAAALSSLVWYSITALTGQTTDKDGSLGTPVRAVRSKINSGAGSVKLTVMQAGMVS